MAIAMERNVDGTFRVPGYVEAEPEIQEEPREIEPRTAPPKTYEIWGHHVPVPIISAIGGWFSLAVMLAWWYGPVTGLITIAVTALLPFIGIPFWVISILGIAIGYAVPNHASWRPSRKWDAGFTLAVIIILSCIIITVFGW